MIAKVRTIAYQDNNCEKMAANQQLNLMPKEPDLSDPLFLPMFEILNTALQPGSTLSGDVAAARLVALLPVDGTTYSTEVFSFVATFLEMAEAIPYKHPSMLRLVSVLGLCLHSERYLGKDFYRPSIYPFQMLGESLYDSWAGIRPEEDAAKYISINTFEARLAQRGLTKPGTVAVVAVQDAFTNNCGGTQEIREAYVIAALQRLIISPVETYDASQSLEHWKHLWGSWRREVAILASRDFNDKRCVWSQEAIELARHAQVTMDSVVEAEKGLISYLASPVRRCFYQIFGR